MGEKAVDARAVCLCIIVDHHSLAGAVFFFANCLGRMTLYPPRSCTETGATNEGCDLGFCYNNRILLARCYCVKKPFLEVDLAANRFVDLLLCRKQPHSTLLGGTVSEMPDQSIKRTFCERK